MNLQELVSILPEKDITRVPDVDISGLAYNSARVKPGYLFACWRGSKYDGHDFAADAVGRGARAVVVERRLELPHDVPQVLVPNARRALALMAAQFWGHPSRRLRLIGVTGTNGKTTTTHLIRHIFSSWGRRVGLIGTIRNVVCDRELPVRHTTPESVDVMSLLDQMVDCASEYAVMEVSSHALAQDRVTGCEFAVAVMTNVTQDHLDYHLTFEDYLKAKVSLFSRLGRGYTGGPRGKKLAVVNADDPNWGRFAEAARQSGVGVVTYAVSSPADLVADEVSIQPASTTFSVRTPAGNAPVRLPLVGRFNVYNALAALAVAVGEGIPLPVAVNALEAAPQVPGRFERLVGKDGLTVIVDYAHTPDGLRNVLETAREIAPGRVIVVFGCGGDRDRGKRPLMGAIARELADLVFVTSDNPRSEDPRAIISDVLAGFPEPASPEGRGVWVDPDRRAAIDAAIAAARPNDLVVVAGKGHETYQIIGDRTIPFDDREVVRKALGRR